MWHLNAVSVYFIIVVKDPNCTAAAEQSRFHFLLQKLHVDKKPQKGIISDL